MKEVYDIETMINCFTYCSKNIKTLEEFEFIIHEDQNDFVKLISHLRMLSGQIGFNNISFDGQVITFILKNENRFMNMIWEFGVEYAAIMIVTEIYEFAQKTIELSNMNMFSVYPEWKLLIPQLDLFKIWHYDNKAKMVGLKWLEYMMDMEDIQEMPIHHSEYVTIDQVKNMIIPYNRHDVNSTYKFYLITIGQTENPLYKGINKIQLRLDVQKQFRINCLNYNDVKIGDAINKMAYSKISGIPIKDIEKRGTERFSLSVEQCLLNDFKFESDQLKEFYERFKKVTFQPMFLKETKGESFNFMGLDVTFGFGGIHSIDKPNLFQSNEEYYLSDKDCTGMYPRTIIEYGLYPEHLGKAWYEGCKFIYYERANKYKPLSKKDPKAKSFAETFKYAANGGSFGKTNEYTSWQYDPLVTFKITITNQFALLKFAEMLLMNGIKVISLNTDGVLSMPKHSQKEIYEKLSSEWEILSKHTLEETLYSKFIQTSVNDYIAVKTDGEIKKKGDYTTDFELHKNKSARIVPLALEQYFINDIHPKETIMNHQNIYDFCLGVKSIGKNRLILFDIKNQETTKLQKINRYYVSKSNTCLLKKLPKLDKKVAKNQINIFGEIDDGTRQSRVEAGSYVTLFNTYVEKEMKDYNIDYDYYINKCYKIMENLIGYNIF